MENRAANTLLLNQLKDLNFSSQNNFLLSKGYSDLSKNLKYLKRFNGDVDLVMQLYESKKISELNKVRSSSSSESGVQNDEEAYGLNTIMPPIQSPLIHSLTRTPRNWPKSVLFLYLDGNNLLFVESRIRKLCLSNRRLEGERLFSQLVLKFSELSRIKTTKIFFDNTTYKEKLTLNLNGYEMHFEVESAKPQFATSDDALVNLAKDHKNMDQTVWVSSDKGLGDRLRKKGGKFVLRTKAFFDMLKESLGEAYDDILRRDK
jgi:hypothetical protein